MKRWAVGGLTVVAGCLARPSATPQPADCGPVPPRDAEYAYDLPENSLDYAGVFRLTIVPTQPPERPNVTGVLHLHRPDTSEHRRPHLAWLIGWFDSNAPDSMWRRITGTRNPRTPGAQLLGTGLSIGQNNVLDGVSDYLRITARSEQGFWGWWVESPGMGIPVGPDPPPAPAGYFCAVRVGRVAENGHSGT